MKKPLAHPAARAFHPRERIRPVRSYLQISLLALLMMVWGCATHPPATASYRPFHFSEDTFAFPNELVWEYRFDAKGKWASSRREPPPSYSHHCFVVARSVRQFFYNARFDPGQPVADDVTYRKLIRRVVSSNPRRPLPDSEKVIFPGYHDLRAFSAAHEDLLKAECGGAWESYFQRGHWRMIWPFTRHHQEAMANQIREHLSGNQPVVVHVVRFPQLLINHAMVIFAVEQTEGHLRFLTYDPNDPSKPVTIDFDRRDRTFRLPQNDYFPGGRIDVYEVYHRWSY